MRKVGSLNQFLFRENLPGMKLERPTGTGFTTLKNGLGSCRCGGLVSSAGSIQVDNRICIFNCANIVGGSAFWGRNALEVENDQQSDDERGDGGKQKCSDEDGKRSCCADAQITHEPTHL